MAKVLNPLLSASASGSIQGLTFSLSRGQHTVRQKAMPPHRYNGKIPANRSIFAWLASQWAVLTTFQRANWEAWALAHPLPDGFGGTKIVSGFNAFMLHNQRAMSVGTAATYNANAPTVALAATIATLSGAAGAVSGGFVANWTHLGTGLVTDKNQINVSAPNLGPGRYNGLTGWKMVMTVAGNVLTAVVTGLIPLGYYGVRVRYIQVDGQASPWLQILYQAKV